MRTITIMLGAALAATSSPAGAQTQVFYEKWDPLSTGHVDGQHGWISTGCQVFLDGTGPNKYAKCQNGASAWRSTDSPGGAGTYHLLLDVWPNGNVIDSTHGKFSLEGPEGRVFQVIAGCDNISVAFQLDGNTRTTLLRFPCPGATARDTVIAAVPRYRVLCDWSTGGNQLRCGAAVYPNDPAPGDYRTITTPSPLRPFDQVLLSTFAGLQGATLFDKIHVARD